MSIAIASPLPILLMAYVACECLPAPKWLRTTVGVLAAIYGVMLVFKFVSANV